MTPDSASTPPCLVVSQGRAVITLNRPAQRNRLENPDLEVMLAHIAAVAADPSVRLLVLTANTADQPRPVFCAGYDVGGFEENAQGASAFERVPEALAQLDAVTLCALNGSVFGGATDLVLACDLAVGLERLDWRMPAAALGLHYYPSGLRRYVARLGPSAAAWAFLTARTLPAEQLLRWGVLQALWSADQWDQELAALQADILALAPLALRDTKRSLRELTHGDFDAERLLARQGASVRSEDFAEGRRAFAERRAPRFSGR